MSAQDIATILFQTIELKRTEYPGRPVVIGVAGAQGSGKSTACRLLEAANRPRFALFSLDDVYLTRAARARMAQDIHPLFVTRGPPGTHDLDLADRVIDGLSQAGAAARTTLPRFDKARDDRAPEADWPAYVGRPEAVLIDGWCIGALADAPGGAPLNRLEAEEDARGIWRAKIRAELDGRYRQFFKRFDAVIYLRPPNWEIVRTWRAQQEAETLGRPLAPEDETRLDRFLQHYERITRSMMAGAHTASVVVQLDERRQPNPPTSPP